MFGLFASIDQKTRTSASNWLELAEKVWNYRRDVLAPAWLRELETKMTDLRGLVRDKAEAAKLKPAIEGLENVLRRTGGTHYPRTETVEWVEFLLVAAIVIIGVRSYFIQPFQIPTNSMWPSYHGMVADVYHSPAEEPSKAMEAVRFAITGARPRRVDAPAAGEILVPFDEHFLRIPFEKVPTRTWLVIPTVVKEYHLYVGGASVAVQVPADFDFDWVVKDAFSPSKDSTQDTLARQLQNGPTIEPADGGKTVKFLRTGKSVRSGDRVLSFDILAGDMLMVDRFSYHFVRPTVGSGFVFRTGQIPGIMKQLDADGNYPTESFYIKRLVGTPGDTLEVREPALYRNGAPITGAASFDKEARRADLYRGYFNGSAQNRANYLLPGETVTVPAGKYFAMGDNSGNSFDSRYWGYVPASSVIGRPLLIYYPFTRINLSQ